MKTLNEDQALRLGQELDQAMQAGTAAEMIERWPVMPVPDNQLPPELRTKQCAFIQQVALKTFTG